MKTINKLMVLLSLLSVLSLTLHAQIAYKSISGKSEMKVHGTSTLHEWHMDVIDFSCHANFILSEDKIESISDFKFSCKSKNLRSDKDRMDKLTWEALKANNHPIIISKFKSLTAFTQTKEGFKAKLLTSITIAGATRTKSLDIKGVYMPNGSIKVIGLKVLKMSDFEIEPPTAMLGTIRTGDDIIILFSIQLTKK